MPWCEPCAKYFVPSALTSDGGCPKCGVIVVHTDVNGRAVEPLVTAKNLDLRALAQSGGQDETVPWHFKLLVVALAIYLSWRVVSLFI